MAAKKKKAAKKAGGNKGIAEKARKMLAEGQLVPHIAKALNTSTGYIYAIKSANKAKASGRTPAKGKPGRKPRAATSGDGEADVSLEQLERLLADPASLERMVKALQARKAHHDDLSKRLGNLLSFFNPSRK
jgi:hypothetical protein